MSVRSRALPVAVLLACGLLWSRAPAQEGADEAGPPPANLPAAAGGPVKQALERQIEALNAEDPEAVMALFHPQAPGAAQVRRELVSLFRARDLRYSLERFHFVAEDEPFAYARCLQATASLDRPDVAVRRVEQLFVFRRTEAGAWKFWTSVLLREASR